MFVGEGSKVLYGVMEVLVIGGDRQLVFLQGVLDEGEEMVPVVG